MAARGCWATRSGCCQVHCVSAPCYLCEVGCGGKVLDYAVKALPGSSCVCAIEESSAWGGVERFCSSLVLRFLWGV